MQNNCALLSSMMDIKWPKDQNYTIYNIQHGGLQNLELENQLCN